MTKQLLNILHLINKAVVKFLLKGFLIGLFASMPVGPLAILSVQRTLTKGLKYGFVIGLGAAAGDVIYATVAAFGISFIADFIQHNEFIIALLGSIFLIFVGIKVYRSDTIRHFRESLRKDLNSNSYIAFKDFLSSLFIALSNPITIIGFGSFFATFRVSKDISDNWQILLLIIGICLGAVAWWFSVSYAVFKLRNRFRLRTIVIINKIAGFSISLLGLGLLIFILFLSSKNSYALNF